MEIRGIDKLALDDETVARLGVIAERMSVGAIVVTRADVIRMAIQQALPVLERRVSLHAEAEVGTLRVRPR